MNVRLLQFFASLEIAVSLAACAPTPGRARAPFPDNFGPIPIAATSQPTPLNLHGATLTVVPSDNHPHSGESVTLSITLANASDEPLWLPLRRQDAKDFVLFVTDATGARAPLTPFGARAYSHPPIDSMGIAVIDVPKDHPHHATLKLTDIYDLSKPGRYTITGRVYLFARGDRSTMVPLTSPPVTIEVR